MKAIFNNTNYTIMKTHILNINEIDIAAQYIKNGELVAFPTETVYGLWANALDWAAAKKIFLAKWRPSDNPLIVHIYKKEQLLEIAIIPKQQEKIVADIIKNFWPGPLTIILPKRDCIPNEVSGGLGTVAVRMPNHEIALKLIELAWCPIAAPSANISWKPSWTEYSHVLEDFDEKIAWIIKSKKCSIGLESTVIDISWENPILLRPGWLDYEDILKIIPNLTIWSGSDIEINRSPWMKYKHYSPEANVIVFEKEAVSKIQEYNIELEKKGKKVRILHPETIPSFWKNLFSLFRESDALEYDYILVWALSEKWSGRAIMNRLRKAATHIVS